jgi:phosphoribosylamine--glycine ligase
MLRMAEVLIIGSGGREAALEQAITASSEVSKVVVAADTEVGLKHFSQGEKPFVIIGPETPLVAGLADNLRSRGYTVFGVNKAAAQYEASKSLAAQMMRSAGVSHPETNTVRTIEEARKWVESNDPETYVIKADGLAAGKGVVLPSTREEAMEVSEGMLDGSLFGESGKTINYQQRHSGAEVSAMVVVGDNDEFVILPIAQDHKRLLDGDKGPNTGGMGAYAPVPDSILSAKQYQQIYDATEKTLAGMRKFGTPFERGLLYEGFILSDQSNGDPVIIEYNVRFGDPETQVILPLTQKAGVDVYRLLRSAAEGKLEKPVIDTSKLKLSALTVCLAAYGYPANPRKGDVTWGMDKDHAGVHLQLAGVSEDYVVTGGRVAYVTAVAPTLSEAADMAYGAIDLNQEGAASGKIGFSGMQLRHDIGYQARLTD